MIEFTGDELSGIVFIMDEPEDAQPCASCGSLQNNGFDCFACGASDDDE
jgi:hypothetical protein